MVADLLELGHCGQHQAAALDPFLGRLDLGQHVGDRRLVQRRLLGGQVAPDLHLQLVRQVGDDRLVGLEPAQDERPGDPPQPGGRFLVGGALDWDRVPLPELLGGPEQAGAGELHDRPQVAEPVLHRGAGERDPGSGRQAADRLSLPGRVVLDVLRLVAHHPRPPDPGELLPVPGRNAVAGDYQIGSGQLAGELVAAEPVRAVVHVHLQLRGEPGRLPLPVADHGHRAHHQRGGRPSSPARRWGSGLHIVHDQAQRLRGLAEPHIVGEDAAKAETAEEGQPRHPTLLIGAQLAVEAGRRLDRFEAAVGLAGEQVAEPAVGVHLDQRQVVVGSVQVGQQRVRSPHRPGLAALQEPQRRAEVPVVEFHPLAAQPDQRDLEPGQLGQLPWVQLLVADRQVVAEVDQVA